MTDYLSWTVTLIGCSALLVLLGVLVWLDHRAYRGHVVEPPEYESVSGRYCDHDVIPDDPDLDEPYDQEDAS